MCLILFLLINKTETKLAPNRPRLVFLSWQKYIVTYRAHNEEGKKKIKENEKKKKNEKTCFPSTKSSCAGLWTL
jgi:hypothetical protein